MPQHFMMSRIAIEMLSLEFLYFLIIIAICLLLYLKTKEVYSLTKHKGIYFFRDTFLFFGLAYLIRLILVAIQISIFTGDMNNPVNLIFYQLILTLLFTYLSTLAILFLVFTMIHKHLNLDEKKISLRIQIITLILTIIALFTNSLALIMIGQIVIFIFGIEYVILFSKKKKEKFLSFNKINFFLLFIVWILNTFHIFRFGKTPILRITSYAISIIIFTWIYYRVEKRLK